MSAILESPLVAAALQIGLIILLALLASRGLRLAADRTEGRLEKTVAEADRLARLKTLVQLGRSLAYLMILFLAAMMVLYALGVNIIPLLAGAGVVGLALSLGAQTLIKDFIAGVLILVENQFAVGDTIKVGDIDGTVERITLRATYLRNLEGRLHIVPNGEIRIVSNLTRDWARAVVELNVAFDADFSKVIHALEAAAQKVQADAGLQAHLLEPPQAMGWVGLKDWAVQVRLLAKTAPGKQWDVATALRQAALEALQAEGVRVALPAQEVRLERAE